MKRSPALTLFLVLAASASAVFTQELTTWTNVSPDGGAAQVAVDPTLPRVLYAAGETGLYRSERRSAGWRQLDSEPQGRLTILQGFPTTMLRARGEMLERSTDRGETWSEVARCDGSTVDDVLTHPLRKRQLLVLCLRGELLRSVDRGAQWRVISPTIAISQVLWHPTDSSWIYALRGDEIFRSQDRGNSWAELAAPASLTRGEKGVPSLSADRSQPEHLFFTVPGRGIYRSEDGGESWEQLFPDDRHPDDVGSLETVKVLTTESGAWLAALGRTVLRSVDGGETWSEALLTVAPWERFELSPSDPRTVLYRAGALDTLHWLSTDAGASWTELDENLGSLAFHPRRADRLYAAMRSRLLQSSDRGDTWQSFPMAGLRHAGAERFAATVGEGGASVLYALGRNLAPNTVSTGGDFGPVVLHRSEDGGVTWTTHPGEHRPASLVAQPGDPATLFAVVEDRPTLEDVLIVSRDGGQTWEEHLRRVDLDLAGGGIFVDPVSPQLLWLTTGSGAFGQIQGYVIWDAERRELVRGPALIDLGSGLAPSNPQAFGFDPLTGRVLAGASDGFWLSENGGESWTTIPTKSLPDRSSSVEDGSSMGGIAKSAKANKLSPQFVFDTRRGRIYYNTGRSILVWKPGREGFEDWSRPSLPGNRFNRRIDGMVVHPETGQVWVGLGSVVTRELGRRWTPVEEAPPGVTGLHLARGQSGFELYAASTYGVFQLELPEDDGF